jgi:hypothetical protein
MAKNRDQSDAPSPNGDKQKKHRSPNFPVFDLGKAEEKIKLLFQAYRQFATPQDAMIVKLGYKAESSAGMQAVAALRAFGMMVDSGSGKDRKLTITDLGMKLALGHPTRPELLKQAALFPKVHREIWTRFYTPQHGLAPDDVIRPYLTIDRPEGKFNPESVAPFLSQFKRTIHIANLITSGNMSDEPPEPDAGQDQGGGGAQVGDYVQWTSQGMAMFHTPRKVVRIEEKNGDKFAAIVGDDGKEGWAPLNQLTVEDPQKGGDQDFKPPVINRQDDPPSPGNEESRWKLPSGNAVLRYPANMTEKDFVILQRQVSLLKLAITGVDDQPDS